MSYDESAKIAAQYSNQSLGRSPNIMQDDRSMLSQASARIAQSVELLNANLENLYRLANKAFGQTPETAERNPTGQITSYGGEAGTLFEQIARLEASLGEMPALVSRYARMLD